MSEEKQPIFQGLMDKAYNRYTDKMSPKEMLALCSPMEKEAVYLGNLNYQVCNGGFRQWVDNGYGLNILATMEALKKIESAESIAILQMLERLLPYINLKVSNKGCWGEYWKNATTNAYQCFDDEEEEDEDDGVPDFLDNLDDQFYKVNEALLDQVEAYFTGQLQQA